MNAVEPSYTISTVEGREHVVWSLPEHLRRANFRPDVLQEVAVTEVCRLTGIAKADFERKYHVMGISVEDLAAVAVERGKK